MTYNPFNDQKWVDYLRLDKKQTSSRNKNWSQIVQFGSKIYRHRPFMKKKQFTYSWDVGFSSRVHYDSATPSPWCCTIYFCNHLRTSVCRLSAEGGRRTLKTAHPVHGEIYNSQIIFHNIMNNYRIPVVFFC